MLTIALRAGRKAAELIERAFERVDLLTIETKSRNDYVTEVDKAAEKEITYHLRKAYPDHSIRGEEGGHQPGKNPDYEWIIDPLDGTWEYGQGRVDFAVHVVLWTADPAAPGGGRPASSATATTWGATACSRTG